MYNFLNVPFLKLKRASIVQSLKQCDEDLVASEKELELMNEHHDYDAYVAWLAKQNEVQAAAAAAAKNKTPATTPSAAAPPPSSSATTPKPGASTPQAIVSPKNAPTPKPGGSGAGPVAASPPSGPTVPTKAAPPAPVNPAPIPKGVDPNTIVIPRNPSKIYTLSTP